MDKHSDYINSLNSHSRLGNWEVNTILSPKGKNKTRLVTFVKHKTILLYSFIIKNWSHQSLAKAMAYLMKYFHLYVKSITIDNGHEYSHNYVLQRKYKIPFYFCHPYFGKIQGEVFNAVDSINN